MGLEVLYDPATMWKIRKGGIVGPGVADPVVDSQSDDDTDAEKEDVATIIYGQPHDADFDAPRPPVHRAPPSETSRKAKNRTRRRNRAAGLVAFKAFLALVARKVKRAKAQGAKRAACA